MIRVRTRDRITAVRYPLKACEASVGLSAVRNDSHSTDACDLSMLSGIRVTTPVILFAPCFVLADGAGTALALALVAGGGSLWSVERLLRLVDASRFWSAGVAVERSEPLELPRSAAIAGHCGAVSRCGQPGWLG